MNNLGRAFFFMFEDKRWFDKILIGGLFCLLSFVFIGAPFVLGYILEVAKRSSENKEVPLPEWDDLGNKFTRGLVFLIILIIYVLPGSLLSMSELFCFSFLWWIAMLFVIPYITVRYSLSGNFADAFEKVTDQLMRIADYFCAKTTPYDPKCKDCWTCGYAGDHK